ncbi:hypothetical protein BC936DRAFT_138261 [Jimgerdemannia flammicorona]|uniref:Uncharacterized protein n=1 Tax=Jimgerdemannia flammicorona TaxID=994334 RepID=A0A433CVN7_9FUNG|nr:hypothetical protein BC936DRAFT_138261 [Jimgerdemannia flammicorona]
MHPATFENINPKRKVVVTYGKRNRLSRADEATPEPFLSDAPQPPRSSKGLDLTNIQNARLRRQPANEASVDNQSPESLPRVLGKRNTSAGSLVQSYALMTVSDQTRDSLPSPSKRKRIGPKRDDRDIYEFPEEEDEATMQVDIMLPRYRSKSQKASSHTSPPKPEPEPNVARKSPHIISRRKTASPAFSDVENPWAPPKPSSRGSVSTSRNPAPPPTDHGDGALKPSRPKQPPATATTNPPSITYADATKPLPRSPRSRRTMSPTSDGEYDRTTLPRSPKSTRARPKPAFELMDIASSRRPKPHRRIQNMAVELPIGATIPTDDAQLDASNPSSPGSNSTSGSHEPTDRSSTPVFQKSMSDNAAASPPQLPPQVLPAFRKTTTSDTVTTIAGRTSRESSLWYMFDNASSSSSGAEAPRTVRSSAKRPAAPARRPNLVARMIQNQNQVQSAPPDDRAERNLFSIIETTSSPTSSPSTPVSASSSSQLPIQSVPTPSPDSDPASSDPPPPPSIAPAHHKPVPKRAFGRSVSSIDKLSDMVPPSARRWNSEVGAMPVDEEIEPPPVLLAPTGPAHPTRLRMGAAGAFWDRVPREPRGRE